VTHAISPVTSVSVIGLVQWARKNRFHILFGWLGRLPPCDPHPQQGRKKRSKGYHGTPSSNRPERRHASCVLATTGRFAVN